MKVLKSISKHWRIVATGFSFAVFGVGAFIIALALSLVLYPLPASVLTKRRWTRAILRIATWFYIRMMWALGLLTFEYENLVRLKKTGQLVVANHPSLLDVVFLMAVLPNTTCIVKEAIARNPFTSRMIALAGYIPNSEFGEELVEKAAQALSEGQSLIIFPEGTRTQDPDNLKFRRGAANIAIQSGAVIQPVFIKCQPPTLRKNEPWYEVPQSRPHFSFAALEPFHPESVTDPERPQSLQARALTDYLKSVLRGA